MKLIVICLLCFATRYAIAQEVRDSSRHAIDTTIRLEEVTVTAQENRSSQTSSVLSRAAMEHVQPFSLTDIMQLLPGGITPVISLHTPQYFRIRSISGQDKSNTLGTGIWVDGMRMSNNSNLQQDLFSGSGAEYGYTGNDTRYLSAGNIESVEVVRGIPSARYGDITAGAVIVRSRAAREPLTLEGRITPKIKSIKGSKGWATGDNGTLNLFADFTRSQADLRSREKLFHKVGIQTAWSGTLGRATFNARLSGNFALDAAETEQDRQQGEYTRARRNEVSANLYGTWRINRSALTSLEYRISADYTHQRDEQQSKHVQMQSVGTENREPGEHTGFFILPQYMSLAHLDGQPIAATAALTARQQCYGAKWNSQTLLGIEWNSEGNRGRGRWDDPTRPSSLWSRPWSYRDVPFLHYAALFAEENFTFHFTNGGVMNLETGVRITGAATRKDQFPMAVEPRLNLRYRPVEQITLKAGWGRLRKMPTLAYLYPLPDYMDHINFRYNDETTGNQLAVLTTDVVRQVNNDICLPQNNKAEIGFTFSLKGMEVDITAFDERLQNGFSLQESVRPSAYRIYQNDNQPGTRPEYRPEGVLVDGVPVSYTLDTTFIGYSQTTNDLKQHKHGIEFVVNTGRWEALFSTLVIDGAWIRQEERTEGFRSNHFTLQSGGKSYPWAPVYEQAKVNVRQRLNTNFRVVTHLPDIRLISTLTLQSIWMDRSHTRYESRYNNPVYMKNEAGEIVPGDIYTDKVHNKYINPLFIMNTRGELCPFTAAMATDAHYKQMVLGSVPYNYLADSFRPYFLVNLRVTKEIGDHFRLTVYANNIANITPSRYSASSASYYTMNPPAFYGAELQVRF